MAHIYGYGRNLQPVIDEPGRIVANVVRAGSGVATPLAMMVNAAISPMLGSTRASGFAAAFEPESVHVLERR
jgi:hypothetical protein